MNTLLRLLVIFALFLILFVEFFHTINAITQDLGRHLINGQIILQTFSVPKTNFFSYTYPNFPFINHHWLSEVIFFFVQQLVGFNGLLILTTTTAVAAYALIFIYLFKRTNLIAIAITSILYFRILLERTDLRPEIFSFLFLSIFIVALYKYREKFTRWIFVLPLIELLWVNTHIYFPIGIAAIGLFLIDGIIKNRKNVLGRYTGILAFSLLASFLITFVNPNGINGAFYPFRVFQNYGYTIEENQNIFFLWQYFNKSTVPIFLIIVSLLYLSLILTIKKTKLIDWLLSIFFVYLSITEIRNLPLFVFATLIPFTNSTSLIMEKINSAITKKVNHTIIVRENIILCFLALIILWQIITISSVKKIGFGVEAGAQNAANFFLKNNLRGPIFNNFDIGSYLDYRFYTKEKVFIDGRPEAYPADFFQKIYIPMQIYPKIFEEVSQKYKINAIFFSHTDMTPWGNTFLKQIINNKQWKMIYFDDYVVIFIKNADTNKTIIKKFAITENSININHLSKQNLSSLLRRANFFNKAGWTSQELKINQDILLLKPNYCPALYSVATILDRQGSPDKLIFINRFNANCKTNEL